MTLGADIFTVRTGRATVMIGPPAALATARGETASDGAADASHAIDLALEACGETHGVRQFCIRCGFPTHGLAHVGNRGLRNWLVNAVRQGRLAVLLLPDATSGAGAVQARIVTIRAEFAMRIDKVTQAQAAGAELRPLGLIEAMQAEAGRRHGPGGGIGSNVRGVRAAAPAGARATSGQGRDLTPSDLSGMAFEDRILEVIRRVLVAFEAGAHASQQDFEALVAPSRLAGTVAVLNAWGESDVGGAGALTDLGLRAFGGPSLDERIMSGLKALSQALACTREALDARGLETAAARLARAVALLGPALRRLIAYGAALPVAVPMKPRANREGSPASRPPERYWPRPAPSQTPGPEFPAPSQQARALRRAAARGSTGCKICAAR